MKFIIFFFKFLSHFSYDVVFTTNLEVIVHKFKKMNARILFGAEKLLWPDTTLEHLYPVVLKHLPRFLNSGLFMGTKKMNFNRLTLFMI